jgi:hypothetical protein
MALDEESAVPAIIAVGNFSDRLAVAVTASNRIALFGAP